MLKVTGQLLANNDDTGYGFYGDDTDYAVIQAGSIEKASEGKFRAAYFGNLFIDTNNHFTQGESSADGTWYNFDNDVKFSFTDDTDVSGFQTTGAKTAKKAENFSIDITADAKGCNPGYKYGAKATYRVIAEDLSATQGSDFDFNDVVFDVDPDADGTGATITILAAGGIWPLTLTVNDGEEYEVHEKLIPDIQKTVKYTLDGVEYNCYPMINTHEDGEKWITTKNEPTIRVTKKEIGGIEYKFDTDDNIRSAINNLIILTVYKYDGTEPATLNATQGEAACKILVDKDFKINSERNSIADENTNFHKYVQGTFQGRFWWKKD